MPRSGSHCRIEDSSTSDTTEYKATVHSLITLTRLVLKCLQSKQAQRSRKPEDNSELPDRENSLGVYFPVPWVKLPGITRLLFAFLWSQTVIHKAVDANEWVKTYGKRKQLYQKSSVQSSVQAPISFFAYQHLNSDRPHEIHPDILT